LLALPAWFGSGMCCLPVQERGVRLGPVRVQVSKDAVKVMARELMEALPSAKAKGAGFVLEAIRRAYSDARIDKHQELSLLEAALKNRAAELLLEQS
jgi:hypothetical protein